MNPELHKFARQLSVWTELIIDNGRTPFRRVDLSPVIHTDQGILQPPLVFWINRQSMMAGGILLLPEQNLAAELQRGASCCDALGLKHFVTWESDRVRIWQRNGERIEQHQQFDFNDTSHPDAFRHLLGEVLESLKLLAVIGLVPNRELSPHYLHNLFQTTLELALPALVNSYRSQRAEESANSAKDADQLADEANRLLLLQLLCLAWHQQLPAAILPEKLERAIQLSLPQLPAALQQTLTAIMTATPPQLPHETAICFHHLLLRLRQLDWRTPPERASSSIQLLINSWDNGEQKDCAEVQLYPASPLLGATTKLVLSDSPALLAAVRLQEALHRQPAKELQLGNLFQFEVAGRTGLSINGILNQPQPPSREERQQYSTLLRTSWPNRRFRIGSDKPLWYWELIHLLGLSRQQQKLSLQLPRNALQSSVSEPFWQLLWENYAICRVSHQAGGQLRLELVPGNRTEEPVTVMVTDEQRSFPFCSDLPRFRNQLLLALELSSDLYRFSEEKLIWPEGEAPNSSADSGLQLYLQSSLCQHFEQLLGLNLQSLAEAKRQLELRSFPQPDRLHLQELGRLAAVKSEAPKSPDRLLSELLGAPEILNLEQPAKTSQPQAIRSGNTNKNLQEELVQQLETAGIPNFPEQYLYFLDQPETSFYQITPPLRVKSELLGEIELEDASGHSFRVYGEELASALLLCAKLQKCEVELPSDHHQLALIQKQYWKDLKQLHRQLNSLCHSRLESSKAADKLVKRVWKKLQLPKLK